MHVGQLPRGRSDSATLAAFLPSWRVCGQLEAQSQHHSDTTKALLGDLKPSKISKQHLQRLLLTPWHRLSPPRSCMLPVTNAVSHWTLPDLDIS